MEKKKVEVNPDKAIKRLPVTYLSMIIFFIFAAIIITTIVKSPDRDLFNATALVLEAGFAIAITWTVYIYSKKWNKDNQTQQKQITELISEIKKIENRQEKIIDEQESSRKRRHDWAINTVQTNFPLLQYFLPKLKMLWEGKDDEPRDGVSIEFKIETYSREIANIAKEIQSVIEQSVDVLDPMDIKDILSICETVNHFSEIHEFRHVIKDLIPGYISLISDILKRLPNPST